MEKRREEDGNDGIEEHEIEEWTGEERMGETNRRGEERMEGGGEELPTQPLPSPLSSLPESLDNVYRAAKEPLLTLNRYHQIKTTVQRDNKGADDVASSQKRMMLWSHDSVYHVCAFIVLLFIINVNLLWIECLISMPKAEPDLTSKWNYGIISCSIDYIFFHNVGYFHT